MNSIIPTEKEVLSAMKQQFKKSWNTPQKLFKHFKSQGEKGLLVATQCDSCDTVFFKFLIDSGPKSNRLLEQVHLFKNFEVWHLYDNCPVCDEGEAVQVTFMHSSIRVVFDNTGVKGIMEHQSMVKKGEF